MMKPDEFADALEKTLEDYKLSRGEKRALSTLIGEVSDDPQTLAVLRHKAFAKALEAAPPDPQSKAIIEWLEEVLKVLQPKQQQGASSADRAEAHFSPSDAAVNRLESFLRFTHSSLDICVFTITDNRLSHAIIDAHQKGVKVRVITDDEKSEDLGSDIDDLRRAGIEVRMDNSPHHMHHKFAIADKSQLLTGSYNWTRSASLSNQENYVIVGDTSLIKAFQKEFDSLWKQFR